METHDLVQGSKEWLAYRATKRNSSDAPAMMGVSTLKTRTQLLNEVKTGIAPEPDKFTQSLYDEGHRCEALCRPVAEEFMGEELYPAVCSLGDLSASLDGLTMLEDKVWEHKMLNSELRAMFAEVESTNPKYRTDKFNELLHPMYQVQMQQQCIVTGVSKILFTASEWTPEGELVEVHHGWYRSQPALAGRILAGWKQFEADLADHEVSTVDTAKPVAAVIEALPALVVNVEGRVTSSNMRVFEVAAKKFIAAIKTDLQTDQDFADAERTVKFCKEGEDRLELVKSQALAQTASIDELFRTVDTISEELRQTRLKLAKLVETRKVSIRTEKVVAGQKVIEAYVAGLNKRLGADWIPRPPARYAEVIKGKRTVESLQNAIDTAVAHDKIEYSALADRLATNRASLVRDTDDYSFLFADFATVGTKPAEDFSAIADQRIRAHRQATEAQRERDEAAKAAQAAAQQSVTQAAPPTSIAPAAVSVLQQEVQRVFSGGTVRRAEDSGPPSLNSATEAELRGEWAQFEVALARVKPQIDKHSAEVDRIRFIRALERMRSVFAPQTINEGEVTC